MARSRWSAATFLLFACGSSQGQECPDLSGAWRQTVQCSGLSTPIPTTFDQRGCTVTFSGEQTAGELIILGDGRVNMPATSTNGECRGELYDDDTRVEVQCPLGTSGDCFLSPCCTLRWER